MRIALVSDLHANLPALEAVRTTRVRGRGGDLEPGGFGSVRCLPRGGGAEPAQARCAQHAGQVRSPGVRFKKRQEKWQRSKEREEYLALEWVYDQLSKKSRKYLRFLSREIRMKVEGKRVLLTHGCPGAEHGYLTADTPEKQLAKLAHEAKAELILCGCSHQPLHAPSRACGSSVPAAPASPGTATPAPRTP